MPDPSHVANDLQLNSHEGLLFFQGRKTNVTNFKHTEVNCNWKPAFTGSQVFSWKGTSDHKGAINLFVIGRLITENLSEAHSNGYGPVYRVNLLLEKDTVTALRDILNTGPFNDDDFSLNCTEFGFIYQIEDSTEVGCTDFR